ncbi:DUF397 domain-containing protein [Streptomyces sp. NPDC058632]|uniref:DUF397 domain-containing protein n=1 Tax=unclassified Streptomyces TaxID=2593676 RepID=UPI003651391F
MSIDQRVEQPDDLAWFKSSRSGTIGGDCVEVAAAAGAVYVRDSRTVGDGAVLRIRRDEWATSVAFAAMWRHRIPERNGGFVRVLEVTWTSPSLAVGPAATEGAATGHGERADRPSPGLSWSGLTLDLVEA